MAQNSHLHLSEFSLLLTSTINLHSYEQNNGQSHGEESHFEAGKSSAGKNDGGDAAGVMTVRGRYSFVGQDGVTYTVNYVADENGFRPTLEQGPNGAIPVEVLNAFSGWKLFCYLSYEGFLDRLKYFVKS